MALLLRDVMQRWPGAGALRGSGWAALQSGGWAVGNSTLLGGTEQLRRRNRRLGRAVHWEDGMSTAGPGQGGGGNGKASVPSLGLQLVGLVLAQSAPCLEIKSCAEILRVLLD